MLLALADLFALPPRRVRPLLVACRGGRGWGGGGRGGERRGGEEGGGGGGGGCLRSAVQL